MGRTAGDSGVVRSILHALPDPHLLTGRDDTILVANPALEALTDYEAGALVGRPVSLILPNRSATTSCIRRDASVVPVSVRRSGITIDGADLVIWSVHDVGEAARDHADLVKEADTDPLTGVANRRGLEHRLASIGRRGEDPDDAAVLTIDLDVFKQINDREGHAVGDAVLRHVADRLRATVRLGDIVARTGGDEFVVVCPGQDSATAAVTAQRLLDRVNRPVEVDGHVVDVSVSIGAAVGPVREVGRALTASDESLYTAKRDGRGEHGPVIDLTAPG